MNSLIQLLSTVIDSRSFKMKKENEYSFYCPFCSHYKPKLQVNIKSGKYHCWICDAKGQSIKQLFYKLNATHDQHNQLSEMLGEVTYTEYKDNTVSILKLPNEFQSLLDASLSNNINIKRALAFLKKRGITTGDIIKHNIGYCDSGTYSERIIIPSYDEDGKLNFFVGRHIYNDFMKYRNCASTKNIIGFDLFINWDEDIILVEGVMDAIAVKRNAIPLFGKTILSELKNKIYTKKVKHIFIALDNDAIVDALKLSEEFISNGVQVHFVKLIEKDPSDMGFKNITELIRNTDQLSFSDLIRLKLDGKPTKKHLEIF